MPLITIAISVDRVTGYRFEVRGLVAFVTFGETFAVRHGVILVENYGLPHYPVGLVGGTKS